MPADTARSRRLGALAWVSVVLWSTAALGFGLMPASESTRLTGLGVMLALTLLASSAMAFFAHRRSAGEDRFTWAVVAVAFAVLGISVLPWFIPGPAGGPHPTWAAPGAAITTAETLAELLLALGWGGLFAWLLSRVTPISRTLAAQRWQLLFDASLAAVSLWVIAWIVLAYAGPMVHYGPGARSVAALLASIGTLVAIVAGWGVWALRNGPASRRWLCLGIGAIAVGMLLWPWWFDSRSGVGEAFAAEIVEAWWVFAGGVVALAGFYRTFERPESPWSANERMLGPGRVLFVAAGPMFAAVAVALAGWASLAGDLPLSVQRFSMLAGLALAAGTVTRGAASALDREDVAARLLVDPLTGLFNVRWFHERSREEVRAARAAGRPLAVVSLDLDDFAGVNVTCGHRHADEALRRIGGVLAAEQGPDMLAARTGGDEFSLLMPGCGQGEAFVRTVELLELIRLAGEAACRTTASAGVAELIPGDDDAEALLERADRALYWVKYRGKDAVASWSAEVMGERFDVERAQLAEQRSLMTLVRSLASVNDARQPTRRDHSRNVADLATRLARALGLDEATVGRIETAALLHDIGMVCVPDDVLDRPGPLIPQELAIVEQHPLVGAGIVSGTELSSLAPWIVAHHERWDGTGYPSGLVGDATPLEARILGVCDTYDGVTSARPHHAARDWRAGVQVVSKGMGTQFDPVVAERFVALMVGEGSGS